MKIKNYLEYISEGMTSDSANYSSKIESAVKRKNNDKLIDVLDDLDNSFSVITLDTWKHHLILAIDKKSFECLNTMVEYLKDDFSSGVSAIIHILANMTIRDEYRDKVEIILYHNPKISTSDILSYYIDTINNNDVAIYLREDWIDEHYNAMIFLIDNGAKVTLKLSASVILLKRSVNKKSYNTYIDILSKAIMHCFKDNPTEIVKFFNGDDLYKLLNKDFQDEFGYLLEINQYAPHEN